MNLKPCNGDGPGLLRVGLAGSGLLRVWVAVAGLLLSHADSSAQQGALRFDRVTSEHGLSAPEISLITQDGLGYIWFATFEGLDRYDGFSIKSYRSNPDDPRALPGPSIQCLFTDRSGELWVGLGDMGLYRYRPRDDGFEAYRHDAEDPRSLAGDGVRALADAADGDLWVATDGGLQRWRRHTGSLTPPLLSLTELDAEGEEVTVESLLETSSGILWLGSREGLYRIDRSAGDQAVAQRIDDQPALRLQEDRAGRLWVGGLDRIDRLSADGELERRYRNDPADPASLGAGRIHDLHLSRAGTLWVASRAGLSSIDPKQDRFEHHLHDLTDPHSLSHDTVLDVFEDRTGVIWAGTLDGASSWHPGRGSFVTFRRQEGREPT